jgi:hypothetical protein
VHNVSTTKRYSPDITTPFEAMRTLPRLVPATTRPLVAAALTAITLILTSLPGQIHAAGLYRPPDMEKDIFSAKKLEIGKFDRAGLVTGLVSVARDFDDEDDVDFELRAHALAIAGRLDKESDKVKDTAQQLIDDARTIGEDDADQGYAARRIYSGARRLARADDNKDNLVCAAYCVDIALRVDPDGKYSDDLKELRDKLAAEKATADWDGMLKSAVQPSSGWNPFARRGTFEEREETMTGGDADKFKNKQTAVKGLVVVTLGNGKHAGAASSIIASALRDDGSGKIKFQLNQKVGPMMANSLESIVNFLKVKYEDEPKDVPTDYKVDIVFEDKDQPVDGPSAGTAMALLLDSLFTGDEIDEKFACTGGITPNGKVTRIGGVAAKIRGATRRKCNVVGVPEGNSKGVADILVLDGIDQLLDIQIFSMKDFKQAIAISRKEKGPEVAETLEAFANVAELIKDQGEAAIKSPTIQKQLEEVLDKMPNHLSAQLLIDHAKGEAPSQLSPGGSFHEIDSNASGVFSTVQMMVFRKKYDHTNTVIESAKEATDELRKLKGKVDERLEDYFNDAVKLCKMIEEGKGDDDEEIYFKRLESSWKAFQTERKKLMDDPELREEMGI